MENEQVLERHGLFNARVPRFTSYPPANRFEAGTGQRHQPEWLSTIQPGEPLSVYVHIPFCKRLCWFCACRTQGTQTLRPVAAYVDTLIQEVQALSTHLPTGVALSRLHLGGGTPTLLDARLMDRLIQSLFDHFPTAADFEFSVEIDPTEAEHDVLESLAAWGLGRASVGVQDFAPKVQEAIGRIQSFEQTEKIIKRLRRMGVASINLDLLYGLPHQTDESLDETLTKVLSLSPDRLALYGYAHVPHISKRQVMIDRENLPAPRARYHLAANAAQRLLNRGYEPIGIDHFALPEDSLAIAARSGRLRRNFQGYTDDPCETLIGIGASAISRFREGYTQNAAATAAYSERIQTTGLAAHRGYAFTSRDQLIAQMIEDLMCRNVLDLDKTRSQFPSLTKRIDRIADRLTENFQGAVVPNGQTIAVHPQARSLTRIIAAALSEGDGAPTGSLAI